MADEILFENIASVVPVGDLNATLERYRRLSFSVRMYGGGDRYGYVDRRNVSLHLTGWAAHDPLRTAATVYLLPLYRAAPAFDRQMP